MAEIKKNTYNPHQEDLKKIKAMLNEVLLSCQICNIPFYAAIAEADDGKSTSYARYVHSAGANHISLSDDQIRKHILIANGFEPVPMREKQSFEPFPKEVYGLEDK